LTNGFERIWTEVVVAYSNYHAGTEKKHIFLTRHWLEASDIFTPRWLYPKFKSPPYLLYRRLGWTPEPVWALRKRD
jgi:hypothetical protein